MTARSSALPTRVVQLASALLLATVVAACATPTGAAAPTAGPATAAATATPDGPAATLGAAPSPGRPVAYALWVERQGFGGSSGLRQVLKGATWIRDHAFEATVFEVDDEMGVATRLAGWLDEHPAAPCWTEYHATVRATLGRLLDAYAAAHDARAAGRGVPLEVGETLVGEAQSAFDLPAPAGC